MCGKLTICRAYLACLNTNGGYCCECQPGFIAKKSASERYVELDECKTDKLFCRKRGTCQNLESTYQRQCPPGFSNYDNKHARCTELNCELYRPQQAAPGQALPGFGSLLSLLRQNMLLLNKSGAKGERLTGEVILEVSPQVRNTTTRIRTNHTEVELVVRGERTPPSGLVSLTNQNTQLDTT